MPVWKHVANRVLTLLENLLGYSLAAALEFGLARWRLLRPSRLSSDGRKP
jgi:hypothetical protein